MEQKFHWNVEPKNVSLVVCVFGPFFFWGVGEGTSAQTVSSIGQLPQNVKIHSTTL